MATNSQDLCADLAKVLQDFWEDYTGVRPSNVRVVADEQTIAVCLEGVLSPGQQQMSHTQVGSEMLEELERRILEQAKPYIQQLVEGTLKREGIQVEVQPNVASGNVLGFFRL